MNKVDRDNEVFEKSIRMLKRNKNSDAFLDSEVLSEIIEKVRREASEYFRLSDIFVDYCDIVSLRLEEKIKEYLRFEKGYNDSTIKPTFVSGSYLNDGIVYGHCFLVYRGKILDPTRCQFDNKNFIINEDSEDYSLYRMDTDLVD